ncbi:HAD-IA family hydrolase [Vibrio cholerae]|uniref:HAD-IA family hydrolase n=1 Tax=Vibrio cholerae TaxID=666 RepID=UPI000B489AE7|nr:HAD-IA family hydrolase [Vibrio cholerae]
MVKVDAVLFDLDDTLVNTYRLKKFRESGDRRGLNENLSHSNLFRPVNEILEAIKKSDIPLGLVTNSPRWYTEEVLKFHGIDIFDVKVCYDDVGSEGVKPSDKGIRLALEKLNLHSRSNVIYVGDQETDYIASYIAGVKPIAPSWAKKEPIAQIPAAILNSETLIDNLFNYDELALIADRTASNRAFNFPKKQMNFIPLNEKGELVPLNREDVKLIALGRYFSQSSTLTAKLHENHALSKDIVAKESSETYIIPEFYVDLLARVVETLPLWVFEGMGRVFDIITVIPSKKNKNPRLENMLNRIAKKAQTKSAFIPDLFEFSVGAESLKTLGGKDRRMLELESHLDIKQKYKGSIVGKSVLVIDDIITTGSTFTYAFKLLENERVEFSFGTCLAKTVSVKEDAKICPDCGKLLKVRIQRATGIHFYGCTGFFEKINRCNYSEAIIVKACPKCGDGMTTKSNRTTGEHFLACEGYNKEHRCTYMEKLEEV